MDCSTSRCGRFTPRKKPDTHFTGGWVAPTAGLDVLEERKTPAPAEIRIADRTTVV